MPYISIKKKLFYLMLNVCKTTYKKKVAFRTPTFSVILFAVTMGNKRASRKRERDEARYNRGISATSESSSENELHRRGSRRKRARRDRSDTRHSARKKHVPRSRSRHVERPASRRRQTPQRSSSKRGTRNAPLREAETPPLPELTKESTSSLEIPSISLNYEPTAGTGQVSSKNLVDTFKHLINAIASNNSNSGNSFPSINVIPEFNPSLRNQTIDTWLLKGNECKSIYG